MTLAPGPNSTPENGIYTGDARELARAIPDESVDLIFTDPVYQNIDDYAWLAETAARVLRPDSACLVWCGIGWIPDTISAVCNEKLSYRWRFIIRPVAMREFHGKLCVSTQECLWLEKGRSKLLAHLLDLQFSSNDPGQQFIEYGSNWGKGKDVVKRLLAAFTKPNALIFDPFTGGGTVPAVCKMLGRHYLAFEIDPTTADLARRRVAETQPPLPGINSMVQGTLDFTGDRS